MHALLMTLRQDHANFLRLLQCVQREIDCLEQGVENHTFNVTLILEVLEYIHTYPQQWHHPLEDALVAKLKEKGVEQVRDVQWLMDEHQMLENQTKIALKVYQHIASDSVVPRERVIEETRGFVHGQLAHIHRENARLYPLLMRCLTDQDWDDVAESLPKREDGLFGSLQRAQYQNLGAQLVREAQLTQSNVRN